MNVDVISKATGAVSQVSTGTIDLDAPSIVRLDIARADLAGIERQGQDLVIRLANGEQVRIVDFYSADAAVSNDLVLREPDGTLWHARTTNTPVTFTQIEDLDDLAVVASGGGSSLALPAILAGVAGAAGLAAVAAGGGGGDDDDQPTQPNPGPGTGVTPDTTAPSSPTATVRGDGAVLTGTGEAGATIQVRDASGAVIGTGVVGADGTYSVTLTSPQIKGDPVVVTQTDPAGNVSPGTTAATPDLTAPAAPSATVDETGTIVTGRGEPGATVTVTDSTGAIVGTTVVAADGTYTLTLPTPRVDGTDLTIVQTDAAGNVSAPVTIATPDLTAPAAPTAAISGDGSQVTGQGEPGATVTIRDATGAVIATVVVGADGNYSAPLVPAQVDGTTLSVVQTDPSGNVSPAVDLGTPDLTAPAPPTIAIDATGTQVSGTGEPGAQVVITDPAGTTLATVTVAADGSYTAILSAPQVDGEVIVARQTDAAGNASGTASTIAPDFTAPAQPTATISADGTSVAGTGEPGARIVFADASGTVIGAATVAADGSYSTALTPAQANGEQLTATQVDAAGNAAPPLSLTAPDATAPLAPVATLDANGTIVTGSGEAGATVTVRDANGAVLGTATVGAQGNYAVTLATVQGNSETLSVTQVDAAGNVSPAATLVAPDLTAPLAPTGIVADDGASISGSGEVGATVTIRSPVGAVIATAVVGADGTYAAVLTPAQVDGEVLTVRQADSAGNVSPTATATAPDLVLDDGPDAPTATVAADGTAVTGVAVAGAAITLYDADGTIIGAGVAGADGSYSVALTPARIDGETIGVTQADADGDVSPPATAIAPDLTAPEAPVATLDPTGAVVTGSGEAGAAITVRAADGTVLGTTTANANGDYAVTLNTVQDAGGTISVTQADAAGNVSPPANLAAPDFVAPDAPVATVAPDGGAVTGTGEAGATVTIRDTAGVVIGSATVAADGSYSAPLATPQANGETVSVTLTDTAGNVSPSVDAVAPDITAPGTPTATLSGDGGLVAGTGEPGAVVTVTAPGGAVIGSATVGVDGSYVVTLAAPQTNGETLLVTQADAAGNISAPVSVVAADVTAPAAPTVVVNGDGTAVTGTGEPGATVTITDPAGVAIGTALVDAGGAYTAQLSTPQVNGETLTATQADAAGNVSGIATTIAPDFTAPAPVDAAINGDGTLVSGTGEVGARIAVVDAAGTTVGTGIVAADGSFDVTLTPAQANGEALSVVQTDAAGNASAPLALTAPDITAPPAPDAALDPSGAIVTGTGEVGATVSVRDAGGTEIGTAIVTAQGTYTVVLATPQVDSQSLSVVQTDAAGNTSVPTPLTASDLTAPDAPVATVGADGLSVTGTGEVGATIVIRDPLGAVIGNAVVAADGTYTAALSPAQVDGEVLTVRQADAAGNVSPPATTTAPDLVADTDPDAPTAAVGVDGTTVAGTAIGGAVITVYDADGAVIANGLANADGSYSVALTPARIDGETIRVTQTDADGDVSPPATAVAPDLTAPIAPTAALDATGNVVTGTGEAGATITVRAADGTPLGTALVNAGGFYAATLSTAQINGEVISVTQADGAGNVSPPIALTASDLVVPTAPLASVNADGTAVTGTGEAGTTATVRDPAGVVIGTAIVAPDGSFTVPLADAQDNGGTLTVTLTDAAGNVSAPANALAPDITAPDVPTVAIAADGSVVTGVGEAGATVSVANANGAVIGTALVAADGSYSVTLTPAQANGEALTVTQADAAGNASGPVAITAPDITAPEAPVVTVSADGTQASGTGEPGATVSIDGPTGATIVTATVAADGTFVAALSPAQANGEQLEAIQVDASGNASPPTLVTAPDITAPAAPTLAITLDGTAANGTGEPGATVTVRNPDGSTIGTTIVAADGSYTLVLDPARIDGEVLSAIQNDPTGNPSPPVTATAPDFDAPVGLTADVSADGTTVTGAGEIGATVTIRDPAGIAIGTAVVGADGTYVATLTTAQVNGEVLSATQVDQDGNVGLPVAATAPDLTAPALPTADVNDTGTAVTGTGEAGATVTVTLPGGAVVATAIVGADGAYTATLTPAQVNGETLSVVQADPTGNPSPAATALAPDLTAPVAPTIAINGDGTIVSGTGEPGATVTITGPGGTPIGTVPVAGDGTYTITLADPQINGETLTATQADPTGNVSGPASTIAPDFVTPAAPTAIVSGDGTIVTGTGEPGAQIVVTDPAGTAIGVATVGVDGSYSTTLSTPQLNGEVLSATQTDGGGNVSPPATALAPDLTAPAIPTLVIAPDGEIASGTGEPGATVTIVGPDGATIGPITVAQDGSYSTVLNPAQLNGQAFTATQADGVGNVSPPVSAVAPDTTAPDAPAAILAAGGGSVTGTGEAGATVRVSGPNGLLGTAVVAADGSFTVPLASVQANGQALTVVQTDRAGNGSLPAGITAPDTTAPGAPSAVVAGDGTSVTGTGEPGAIVTITAPGGDTIGTATVNADGIYTTPLSTPQANGEQLIVRQADAAGNVSPLSSVLAPDITAPSAPTATVSANGGFVTGTGEAGATVRVTGPDGGLLGTAIVAANGTYAVPLSTAQTDSQSLTVTQTDRANNPSLPTIAVAPDDTAPFSPTATVSAQGDAVVGAGVAGATITVSNAAGLVIGTATVDANGNYTAPLDTAQRNGEVLSVVQSDTAGNVSPPVPAIAPDLTAPGAPSINIGAGGDIVTGLGEPGATVTITRNGLTIGTAVVGSTGSYQVTLDEPQRNGETLVATQRDGANNASDPASAVAPDLTPPAAPTALLVAGDGTTVTGTGEPGARVEVRVGSGPVIGNGVVAADGSFTVTLVPAQTSGATLGVTQKDAAGNESLPGNVVAPFDIDAFDNANTASIDLVPPTSSVNLGSATYPVLLSLGLVNLQAEVLSVPDVRFTVEAGHSLDAVFSYGSDLLDIGVASDYAVVVQRFDGTNWVAVDGSGNASLLDIRVFDGNLSATETLGPGEYRAFLTFSGTAGAALFGNLAVAGVDSDFTAVPAVVSAATSGNVITDQGAGGAVDIVGPGTQVDSVTIGGVTTAVAANGTVVDGAWGTLTINLDGSYTYTPDASALAIGKTDAFTYTLIDPTDGERESAVLSIAIGSPDIAGAPVAAADVAVAAVTYDNVVATTAPTTAFSFNSTGPLGLLSTGAGGSTFTVAANTVADVSIAVARAPGLSVLPTYTLTVRNEAGTVIERVTQIAVVGLPIGTGAVFTVEDLPVGRYSYTISSSATAGSFVSTVSVGATTTFLDQFTLGGASTAEGNLLDNDTANTPFAGIRVDSGAGFTEIGDTAVVLTGQYGTLTVNETGDYLYSPSATLGYSTVDLFDTFTYQVIQPNGTVATSTLTVTIDVPADGTIAAASVSSQIVGIETDVIALDAFVTSAIDADASVTVAPDSDAIGRAIYDVFEGQGELENVLANFLPPEQPAALEGVGDAGHPAFAIDVAMPAVADPLDYIVAPEDPDRHGTNTNPVY
jgi:VCBS repeat-containing protein